MPVAAKDVDGNRIYDKLHFCLFCCNGIQKIGRHLQTKHRDEDEVKKLCDLSQKTKHLRIDALRYHGDFYHNVKVLKLGGQLVVWRRPNKTAGVSYKDYIPCKICLAFVTKAEMWRHVKSCEHRKNDENVHNLVQQAELLLYPNQFDSGATKELSCLILHGMINDEISKCVKGDNLIVTYGSFMLSTCGMRRANGISQRMRILARLLLEIRKKRQDKCGSLASYIKPECFDLIVTCTRELGGFRLETVNGESVANFETPSLPLKIGYSIEKCCSLLKGIGIKARDKLMQEDAADFLELYRSEWVAQISTVCLKTMDESKFNRVTLLPITEDLLKLRTFLKMEIPKTTQKLKESKDLESWRHLAEILATRSTIFNRRRGNEVFQLVVKRFNDRHVWKDTEMSEIKDSLSPLEKRLAERYSF